MKSSSSHAGQTTLAWVHAAERYLALAAWGFVLFGCAATHRPESFANSCKGDGECQAPFRCMDSRIDSSVPPRLTCTRACGSDKDCPDWDDDDDCSENFRNSRCIASVCVLSICEG